MRTLIMKTITAAAFAVALSGDAAILGPGTAAADVAKCPCTPPPQPSFPTVERQEPAAVASEMWVLLWQIMHGW